MIWKIWKWDKGILTVVVLLIGIFGFGLCVPRSTPDWPAESGNMQEIGNWLTMYRNSHNQSYPSQSGADFLLELWRSGVMERNEKNARRFFSVAEPYAEYLPMLGLPPENSIADYLSSIPEGKYGAINYAAFDSQGDETLRNQLLEDPASVTIVANATFAYRDRIYYMTGDREVHVLYLQDLLDQGLLTENDIMIGLVPVGKDSPISVLCSVTN